MRADAHVIHPVTKTRMYFFNDVCLGRLIRILSFLLFARNLGEACAHVSALFLCIFQILSRSSRPFRATLSVLASRSRSDDHSRELA